jgi:hypothetical protein
VTTKSQLQNILKGILHTEDKNKHNHKKTGGIKLHEKNRQALKSASHTQIFEQQKQLNGRSHHIPININTECQWTQLPHEKTQFGKLV